MCGSHWWKVGAIALLGVQKFSQWPQTQSMTFAQHRGSASPEVQGSMTSEPLLFPSLVWLQFCEMPQESHQGLAVSGRRLFRTQASFV
jgi:hypothetical protein